MLRALLLTALLAAGCAPKAAEQPKDDACGPPICGSGFKVLSEYKYDAGNVHGWNVHLTGDGSMREIADGLAATETGRRFVVFYSEPITAFRLPPNSVDDPRHAKSADASLVGYFDYRGYTEPYMGPVEPYDPLGLYAP